MESLAGYAYDDKHDGKLTEELLDEYVESIEVHSVSVKSLALDN